MSSFEQRWAQKAEQFISWCIENQTKVLTAGGVAVAFLLIGSVFFLRQKEARETTNTQIAQAQALLGAQQFEQADALLTSLRTSAPTARQRRLATYFLGTAKLGRKEFSEAATLFDEATRGGNKDPLTPLALANQGFALESKPDYAVAASIYQRFMQDFSDHFLAARTQLALGRSLFLAGQKDEARQALEKLIDLYPSSKWAETARGFLDKLRTS